MATAMDQLQQSTIMSMKTLLEAGVHFGHQSKRWNPKMKRYIHGERNSIHIIDLQQSVEALERAQNFVTGIAARGGSVLFVGTKKQAQEVVKENAERSGMTYVNHRWLGGLLTNFVTIRSRLRTMADLEARSASGDLDLLPKTEQLLLRGELARLQQNLGGIKSLRRLPDALFVIDPKREHIAIKEASRLGLPIIAMVDTNCDPDPIEYVIPANDDAIRSIRLITGRIADAAVAGQMQRRGPSEGVDQDELEAQVAEEYEQRERDA